MRRRKGGLSGLTGKLCRFLVGFFAPTALTVLLVEIFVTNPDGIWTPVLFWASYMQLLGFVYPVVAFQAAAYTLLMELCVNPLVANRFLVGLISAFLTAITAIRLGGEILLAAACGGWCVGYMLSILYREGHLISFSSEAHKTCEAPEVRTHSQN